DHFAIVESELIGRGVIRQCGIGEISVIGAGHGIGDAGRHGPVVAARAGEKRRILDPRIAVRIRGEREPESLPMPRRREFDRARMYDLLRALVCIEQDRDGSTKTRGGAFETLRCHQRNITVTVRLENAIGTTADIQSGAEESDSAEYTRDVCASSMAGKQHYDTPKAQRRGLESTRPRDGRGEGS